MMDDSVRFTVFEPNWQRGLTSALRDKSRGVIFLRTAHRATEVVSVCMADSVGPKGYSNSSSLLSGGKKMHLFNE
jgi:hypothetical protein